MEQHPIPRQITSFEFKLIGFMTLKQFLYLVISFPLGFIVYFLFPIPILNILAGVLTGVFGLVLAFVPIQDKPVEEWLRNLWKRINSPTQYFYHKYNPPISLLDNLYYVDNPHIILTHVTSVQMLSQYLASSNQKMAVNSKKQQIQKTIENSSFQKPVVQNISSSVSVAQPPPPSSPSIQPSSSLPVSSKQQHPFFTGTIKNSRHIPLSGILIYVKNKEGVPVRLLKTNPYGVFATYSPLLQDEYVFELKDPKNTYFFDTMKIQIQSTNQKPFEFYSKEML